MIKTQINKHELEYFLYAMTKAFYPTAPIYAPDKAEHNMEKDDEPAQDDVIKCTITETGIGITIKSGLYINKDFEKEYTTKSSDEKDIKDELRGIIYDALSEVSGKRLPWGNLTGIRPTKLFFERLVDESQKGDCSFSDTEVINKVKKQMTDVYRVSDIKSALGARIAITEENIIRSTHATEGYSIYVGIPFCPSTCLYCSFTSNPIVKYAGMIPDYIACLKKEISATREMMKGVPLDTIYIGGGTPTALSAGDMDELLEGICCELPMNEVKEFTVEAGRADSIDADKLHVISGYPVTRISVNPQTFSDDTLKLIGRHHTSEDVKKAFALAREIGFNNINMDMILGLPGENMDDVRHTMDEITALSPESVTVHSLAIKRASALKKVIDEKGIRSTLDFDEAMAYASEKVAGIGLEPYYLYRQKDMGGNLENTGFAKKGCYGIYNILMMEEVQSIIACGAGSVSKRVYPDGHIERCDNVKDVKLYISEIEKMINRKRELFKD